MASLAQDLYERSLIGDATLLEDSLRIQQDVLDNTPRDHPERVMYLARLGVALLRRFQMTGDIASLSNAIMWQREAASLCPPSHPLVHRSHIRSNLGSSLLFWAQVTEDSSAMEEGLEILNEKEVHEAVLLATSKTESGALTSVQILRQNLTVYQKRTMNYPI